MRKTVLVALLCLALLGVGPVAAPAQATHICANMTPLCDDPPFGSVLCRFIDLGRFCDP